MDTQDGQYRGHGISGEGIRLFGVAVGLQTLVVCAISVRFVSRKLNKCGIGWDDWMIALAATLDLSMTAITITAIYYGYGYPGAALAPSDKATALQMFWLTQIIYKLVMCCCKLSFCLFYIRVFPRVVAFRYANYAVIGLILGYSTASVITTIVQCFPVARVWDKSIPGVCINLTIFWYANAVYSIFTDFLIIILPCAVCWKLQTNRKDWFGLMFVFSVGIFVIVASIVRITTLDMSSKSMDPTQGTLLSTTWTSAEVNTAIIVACLPAFKTPLKWLRKRYIPSTHSEHTFSNVSSRPTRFDAFEGRPKGLGDIAITTDVNIEFEDKSRQSSLTIAAAQTGLRESHKSVGESYELTHV